MAHKATLITKQVAQTGMLHLNTDGTTKSQKKLKGVALNGQTISINEVAYGSADSRLAPIIPALFWEL